MGIEIALAIVLLLISLLNLFNILCVHGEYKNARKKTSEFILDRQKRVPQRLFRAHPLLRVHLQTAPHEVAQLARRPPLLCPLLRRRAAPLVGREDQRRELFPTHRRERHRRAVLGAGDRVGLGAEEGVAVGGKVLRREGRLAQQLFGRRAEELEEEPQHRVVGGAAEEDATCIQLVDHAAERPHVHGRTVGTAEDYNRKRLKFGFLVMLLIYFVDEFLFFVC